MNIYKKVMLSCLLFFSVQSHGMSLLTGLAAGLATSIGVPHYFKNSYKKTQLAALSLSPIVTALPFLGSPDKQDPQLAATCNWLGSIIGSAGVGVFDALYSEKSKMSIAGEFGVSFGVETVGFLIAIIAFDPTGRKTDQ